jgi:hypothetical protein
MYGDDQRLTVATAQEGGTLALVEVPYRPASPGAREGELEAAPAGHDG